MEELPLLEARVRVLRDDDVIEDVDAQDAPRLDQPPGDREILLAGRGVAGGMVVRQDQTGRGDRDRGLEDLARVHDARVQAPDRDDLPAEHLVSRVEIEADEVLGMPSPDVTREIEHRLGSPPQRRRVPVRPEAPPQLRRREELRRPRLPHAAHVQELLHGHAVELPERDRRGDARAQFQNALARHARAEEDGHEVGIRQGRRTRAEQSLARPLVLVCFIDRGSLVPPHPHFLPGCGASVREARRPDARKERERRRPPSGRVSDSRSFPARSSRASAAAVESAIPRWRSVRQSSRACSFTSPNVAARGARARVTRATRSPASTGIGRETWPSARDPMLFSMSGSTPSPSTGSRTPTGFTCFTPPCALARSSKAWPWAAVAANTAAADWFSESAIAAPSTPRISARQSSRGRRRCGFRLSRRITWNPNCVSTIPLSSPGFRANTASPNSFTTCPRVISPRSPPCAAEPRSSDSSFASDPKSSPALARLRASRALARAAARAGASPGGSDTRIWRARPR